MEKGKKISKKKSAVKSRNYEYLLSEGKQWLQNLTGLIWNDYNIHDPGITILELLCYAITDLGYRCNHSINDIIDYDPTDRGKKDTLLPAEDILPSAVYTFNDLRRLLIDIKIINGRGINNAWFTKHPLPYYVDCYKSVIKRTEASAGIDNHKIEINGIYDLSLEIDESITSNKEKNILKNKAREVLNANRNLCEVFEDVKIINQQEFIICAEIDIEPDVDKDFLEAVIFNKVKNYLTPRVPFYSFSEMLKKGKTIDEIFEGPLLKNGFIDFADLKNSELRTEIRLSDIINIIMNIKGVKAVKDILINDIGSGATVKDKWRLKVKTGYQPIINMQNSNLIYFREHLPVRSNYQNMLNYFSELNTPVKTVAGDNSFINVPAGEDKEINNYRTIQNHFPINYGIGEAGLPESASAERKAQAKQLKAYLLFFEQVLANYMAQLSHVKDLFSISKDVDKTYYTNLVAGIEGFEDLIKVKDNYEKVIQDESENNNTFLKRRNRFLNHLLARFAETFNEYVMTLYTYMDDFTEEDIINSKIDYLQKYPKLSAERGRGINYTDKNAIWDTDNVSGLMQKVSNLLGIKNYFRRDLVNILSYNYQEVDTDDVDEYRFRIIDDDERKIILSSSGKYLMKKNASQELLETLTLALDESNYQLKQSKDGRFYFNLLNKNQEIVARRIEYFKTEEERKKAIDYLISFLNEKIDDEGFFVVEHILLLPRKRNDNFMPICVDPGCSDCADADPYSFRITVLLPAWSKRFKNIDFRKFVEKTIRMETPAHILPRICWVNQKEMSAFERDYKDWLTYLVTKKGKRGVNLLNNVIETLSNMKSVYPEAILHDCGSPNISDSPFVLDKTNLGTN